MALSNMNPSPVRSVSFMAKVMRRLNPRKKHRMNPIAYADLLTLRKQRLSDVGVTRDGVREKIARSFLGSFIPDATPYQLDEFSPDVPKH